MKIAITGPLADHNLGDYGMFVNNIYDLGADNEYTVFTYNSAFVKSLKKDFLSDFNVDFKGIDLKAIQVPELSLYQRIREFKNKVLGKSLPTHPSFPTPLEITNRCENYEEIYNTINDTDILIVSGGGYFNDLWYEWSRSDDLFKIIIPIVIATQLKKKIFFTANGFGPFDRTKQFYSMIFSEAARVGATFASRDNKLSPLYLNDLSINNYQQLPDDLYIINNKLKHNKKKLNNDSKYVIVELYGITKDLINNVNVISGLIDELSKQGIKTVFMPFDINKVTLDFILDNIKSDDFEVFEYDEYLKLDTAIEMIANAEYVICNRYHAMVLSISCQTPVINIMKSVGDFRYYYNKNAGLLDKAFGSENINYNDYILTSIESFKTVIEEGLDKVIARQNTAYSSDFYRANKESLRLQREEYISSILSEGNKI